MKRPRLLIPLLLIFVALLAIPQHPSFGSERVIIEGVSASNSDDYPHETYVFIYIYHGKHDDESETFTTKNITKAVRVGDYVSVQFIIENQGKLVISATVDCNFTQGQDIAGPVEFEIGGLSAIIAGKKGGYYVKFDELPKVGVISMNFSYEVYWEEDGELKKFTSGGTAYEVHLEVKEKGSGRQYDFLQIGGIVAIIAVAVIVFIVKRR